MYYEKIWFPSPLGDYVFNRKEDNKKFLQGLVSVPSRGLCFQSQMITSIQWMILSFRPLSGIMFSIFDALGNAVDKQKVSVPSRGLCFQS